MKTLFGYVYHLTYSEVPDYVYIYRLLQSGLTGVVPTPPESRSYQGLPVNGCATDEQHRRVTQSLLVQLQAAASVAVSMSDDTPCEASADDTVAISSAAVSPPQHPVVACNPESMSQSSSIHCSSEEQDSNIEQAISVHTSADDGQGNLVETQSCADTDNSNASTKRSHSSPARLAQAVAAAQHTLPSSTCPNRQSKRQRVDQDAIAACFGQVMQVVLESSQEE